MLREAHWLWPTEEPQVRYVPLPAESGEDDGIEVRYFSPAEAAALAPHVAREAPAAPARPRVSAVTEARQAGEAASRKFRGDPYRLAASWGLEVRYVEPRLLEGRRCLSHRTLGLMIRSERRAYIDRTLDTREAWTTVAHEVAHFAWPDCEEAVAEAFAGGFMAEAPRYWPLGILGCRKVAAGWVYTRKVSGLPARMLRRLSGAEVFLGWIRTG